MDRYTLLCLKWINQQGPPVGNRELCSALCGAWMGGEFGGRVHACVGMYLDGFALPLKLPLLLIGYMPTQNRKLKKREKIKES